MGSLADQAGRRPAYICCFVVYIVGNIALALQRHFPALLILRAVQSSGSSGTVALASAVAADIITPRERGYYMGLASLGNILAPSLGPILGGLLSQYLGWPAIFWFLAIAAAAFFVLLLLFFPETCRAIVGDGSTTALGLNRTFWSYMKQPLNQEADSFPRQSPQQRRKWTILNPWFALRLFSHRPVGLILLVNGVIFASYYAVTAGVASLFKALYNLHDLGIGLSFIPAGLGSLVSATTNGVLVDWNYRRMYAKIGQPVRRHQREDISEFSIEQARLQIGFPMTMFAAGSITVYGTLLAHGAPLWAALSMIFFICFFITAAYNVMNVLIVDLYYTTPATAMAANNLVRCFLATPGSLSWRNGGLARNDIECPRYEDNPEYLPSLANCVSDTKTVPDIGHAGLHCNTRYLILFLDLDVMISGTAIQTVVLHWYQSDLIVNCTETDSSGYLVPSDGSGGLSSLIAEYIGPQPPPGSHHRYVYLLYAQPLNYCFPACFSHIPPENMAARAGFDVRQFMQAAGLDVPLAVNYFFGRNDSSGGSSRTWQSATTTSFQSVTCDPAPTEAMWK
ncbi:hypothetical protein N7510_001649 [Penicillium lagena]|uniref:uncharacterized protein n=1 Tax=Penicillium lagena TaxID=94218 RepID=UPI002541779B|nr:uncharacterized protein N7510_001649 [Penicillium lagena]KAJ5625340.1 hypothetical protein N7510_001649 [Penicillium lagena]